MSRRRKARVAVVDPEPHDEARVEHTVALPRPSLYMVTIKDGQGETYDFVLARTDAEARNEFPEAVVLKTNELVFGEDPLHATNVSFLGSLLPHGQLRRLLGEITKRAIAAQNEKDVVVQLAVHKRRRR